MNLPEEYCKEDSYFKILPVAFEKNLTAGIGTSNGPKEIIKASKHLEYYDEQFENEPFLQGIKLLKQPNVKNLSQEEMHRKIQIPEKGFTTILGGDHSVTIAIIKHLLKKQDFSVIILDAHSDFRHSWNNSKYNHACISKRISEKTNIVLIGVRSQDIDEAKEMKEKNIPIIKAYEMEKEISEKLLIILKELKDKVYISIDVDVFDFIKNTGTPEPGGISWNQTIKILEHIFKEKEVIGADITEFAPKNNFVDEAYSLAKLSYKLMSLKTKYSQRLNTTGAIQ